MTKVASYRYCPVTNNECQSSACVVPGQCSLQSQTEPTAPDLLENIARVIEPTAFLCADQGRSDLTVAREPTAAQLVTKARAKAAAILALLPAPIPQGDGWLDELEAAAKKATPGEWSADWGVIPPDGPERYCDVYKNGGEQIIASVNERVNGRGEDMEEGHANATYIALANPETILRLIAIARAAGGEQ